MDQKKLNGEFFSRNAGYILEGFQEFKMKDQDIIEPFTGVGSLVEWLKINEYTNNVIQYDITPRTVDTIQRDTLVYPPDYTNKWIVTNPPYIARNKNNTR